MRILVATLASMIASTAVAGYFDGKTTLLCTAHRISQCDAADGCIGVHAEEIGAAGQWIVDFPAKQLRPSDPDSARRSKIDQLRYVDGTLYAQAIEDGTTAAGDGAAWSVSISDPDGTMTLAVAGPAVAFVGTGACVPMAKQ